jgi:hypothetical protein
MTMAARVKIGTYCTTCHHIILDEEQHEENGPQRTHYVGVTLARLPDIVEHVTHTRMGAPEASHVTQTS